MRQGMEPSTTLDTKASESTSSSEHKKFVAWRLESSTRKNEVYLDALSDRFPFEYLGWNEEWKNEKPFTSCYGYVWRGPSSLTRPSRTTVDEHGESDSGPLRREELRFPLASGMYFACPGEFTLQGGSGIVIRVPDRNLRSTHWSSSIRPLFSVGWPLEVGAWASSLGGGGGDNGQGRLPYIDGCSDTLLISPVVLGAPCLNHLHFPPLIEQTQHTHPSGRAGIVVRGRGKCLTPSDEIEGTMNVTKLEPGTAFVIPTEVQHAFETEDGETLDVVAFHPDSDFGPTPTDHPMLNRTYVDGVSASQLPEIQSKLNEP